MDWGVAFGLVLLTVGVGGAVHQYVWQRRMAKEGHCGLPWVVFDMDSGGAMGTKCQKCGEHGPWFDWYTKGLCSHNWVERQR